MELKSAGEAPLSGLVLDGIDTPDRMAKFGALLDRAFPVPAGSHFLDDFPIWGPHADSVQDPLTRIGVFHGDELAGCAGVRLGELQGGGSRVRVALVGAVATDEKYRHRGLASKMVEYACQWAQARGARHVVLWGSEHQLYQRIGFALAGSQVRVSLDALELPEAGRGIAVQRGWNPALFGVLQRRGSGLVLRDGDREWYSKHRHVEWFWTGPAEKPTAYAAAGRGIDLQNFVHEFGGEPAQLALLLSKLAAERPELSLLGNIRVLESLDLRSRVPLQEEVLCLLRNLDDGAKLPDPFWIWGLDAV